MKYDSIDDWYSLIAASLVNNSPDDRDVEQTLTKSESILRQIAAKYTYKAASGLTLVEHLKKCSQDGIVQLKAADLLDKSQVDFDLLATNWQVSQMLKKFKHGSLGPSDIKASYESFERRNAACDNSGIPDGIIRRMRTLLEKALPSVDDDHINGRFGPGAVAERFDGIERWDAVPDFSFNVRNMRFLKSGGWSEVGPARLCAVPKDCTKYRLITIEPAENTFGQQYVRGVLLEMMKAGVLRHSPTSLEESLHPRSIIEDTFDGYSAADSQRARAVEGSFTGTCATLDLSDASDTVSWAAVQLTFPSRVVAMLERFRTPKFLNPLTKEVHELKMYGGMGNATTFPVETLFFWALVSSLSEEVGDREVVSVFGDDIVCGTRAANNAFFQERLSKAGLKLNADKCGMSQGPGFRESCGIAAIHGRILPELIRIPGYLCDSDASDCVSLCALINRCYERSKSFQGVAYEHGEGSNPPGAPSGSVTESSDGMAPIWELPRIDYSRLRWSLCRLRRQSARLHACDIELANLPFLNPPALTSFLTSFWSLQVETLVNYCCEVGESGVEPTDFGDLGLAITSRWLQQDGLWIYYPDWLPRIPAMDRFSPVQRWNESLQRWEVQATVKRADFLIAARTHLTYCERLGVVAGLLSTRTQIDRKKGVVKTLLRAPSRGTKLVRRWVAVE